MKPLTILTLFLISVMILTGLASAIPTKDQVLNQYRGYYPQPTVVTPNPQPVVTVDTEHINVYRVMILDGIDQEMVRHAILYIPNAFGYEIVEPDPTQYRIDENNCVKPLQQDLIILFDSVERNATVNGIYQTKLAGSAGYGISIGMDTSYVTDVRLSRLIYHECSHDFLTTLNIDEQLLFGEDYNTWKLIFGVETTNRLTYNLYKYVTNT